MEEHIRRECSKIHCKKCNNRGHEEEECYTNLDRRTYSEQRAKGRYYRNMIQNSGYGTHNDIQRTRREGWTNNKGYEKYKMNKDSQNEERLIHSGNIDYDDSIVVVKNFYTPI